MQSFGATFRRLVLALACTGLVAPVLAAEPLRSETMPLAASQGLILDLTEAASRAVAVGDRGQILVSESRTDWRQVPDVPTRATLTAVTAAGDAVWAVGHDGTILNSRDGGLTWVVQREDVLDTSPDAAFDPRQGVPLLDILMLDANHGFAVGAYSQLLRTEDGGATWTFVSTTQAAASSPADDQASQTEEVGNDDSWTLSEDDLAMEDVSDPHFNAIARTGSGALLIVGERGVAFRSRDGGASWERIELPYGGSMFGVIGYEGDHAVAFGMRGNVYETFDLGESWSAIDTGTDLSLMGGAVWGEGGFALVGANGIVVLREGPGQAPVNQVYSNAAQETPVLAGVLARANRGLLVSGEKGVDQYTPRKQ
ncbi:MAG TPA: YCF48-related protein [Chiayiivirga sp.]|nr:YCF48-related protein [Chiayiivirga sp.]